jgi:hypothetical protein
MYPKHKRGIQLADTFYRFPEPSVAILSMFNSVTKSKSLMSDPSRRKIGIITVMFLIAGFAGIFMGLSVFTKPNFIVTALGMVNISLGIFLGFRVLRKNKQEPNRRR